MNWLVQEIDSCGGGWRLFSVHVEGSGMMTLRWHDQYDGSLGMWEVKERPPYSRVPFKTSVYEEL